jgi:hypothetical protein
MLPRSGPRVAVGVYGDVLVAAGSGLRNVTRSVHGLKRDRTRGRNRGACDLGRGVELLAASSMVMSLFWTVKVPCAGVDT